MKAVYNLADLSDRAVLDAGEMKPALYAVIGMPIAHSASPRMHQAALDSLGMNARYIRLEVPEGHVAEALRAMQRLGFRGCNVTVPHKLAAMESCDEVEAQARALGAVNTVVFHPSGMHGHNTDGPGFAAAVHEVFAVQLTGLHVAVVGAGGGAGQAIAVQCGLSRAGKVTMINRTLSKLDDVAARLAAVAPSTRVACVSWHDPALAAVCQECDLIVNATSLGLNKGDAAVLPSGSFRPGHLFYDIVYQPHPTANMEHARSAGARVSDGKSMLLHQGALAFQHWHPGTAPLDDMRAGLGN